MVEKNRWAIIGAGNGGQALAAYLNNQGLTIQMYESDATEDLRRTIDILNKTKKIELNGRENCTGAIEFITSDMEKAIAGAEVILVTLPSQFHKGIAEKMAPYVNEDQVVILNPIAPLGPIEFKKALEDHGNKKAITLAGSCTLLFAARLEETGRVHISGKKDEVSIAAFPGNRNAAVEALTKPYFPEFKYVKNILNVSFDNLNFEFHPGPALLYLAKLEKKEDFEYYHGFTPGQIKVVEAIDKERMELCRIYQVDAQDVRTAFLSMYPDPELEDKDLYTIITHAKCYDGLKAPSSGVLSKIRYFTEDVPYSLVAIQALAKIAKAETPVIDSIVTLVRAVVEPALPEGRTMKELGFTEDTTVKDVIAMCDGNA